MSKKKGWRFRTDWDNKGERFVAMQTWNTSRNRENIINFWHVTSEHTFLYTIKPNKLYNKKVFWSEELCKQLLEDINNLTSGTKVVRFVVDGEVCFSSMRGKNFPKTPKAPNS